MEFNPNWRSKNETISIDDMSLIIKNIDKLHPSQKRYIMNRIDYIIDTYQEESKQLEKIIKHDLLKRKLKIKRNAKKGK